MQRERLLIVIDGMEVGGSQRQVQQLLKGLDRQRWKPELAYFRDHSSLADEISDDGVTLHYLPKRRRLDLPFLLSYARLLRNRNYALVHAFSLTAELSTVLARALSGRRPPLVCSERSFALDKPHWFWWLKRLVLRCSAAVIANSRAGAEATARRTHTPMELFSIVPNGVEIPFPMRAEDRERLRQSLGVPTGRLMGLFVGRLVQVKNLPCLIQAMTLLGSKERPWIALAGDGPLRTQLCELADERNVGRDLCFLGPRNDVARLMQVADFLVLPSHFEGLSNALLEAMAAGCPVLASAVGGNIELVEGARAGVLFPSGDALALAAAMTRLAEPELRAQLGQAGRQYVKRHHSQESLTSSTSAVYERCLRQTRHAQKPLTHQARGAAK